MYLHKFPTIWFALHTVALCQPVEPWMDVSDRYIISLRRGVDLDSHLDGIHGAVVADLHGFKGVTNKFKVGNYQAYSAHLAASAIDYLRNHAEVAAVHDSPVLTVQDEDDGECEEPICISGKQCPRRKEVVEDDPWHIEAPPAAPFVLQRFAPYNLHRISHRGFSDTSTYWFTSTAGRGTFAYVLDGGIDPDHVDLGGRVSMGFNAFGDFPATDTQGHGTYVATIIGGNWYGVAKRTNLVSVKMLHHGYTTLEMVLAGYNWAVKDIVAKRRIKISVINLSISGTLLEPLNAVIDEAYGMGIVTVVPAGNSNKNAMTTSPASARGSITVAATDSFRRRMNFSNWGPGVQIFAPGYKICGGWVGGGHRKTRTRTGTAPAAAHLAGLVVYFRSFNDLYNAEVTWNFIRNVATPGVVKNTASSPDRFAYNLSGR